MQKLPLSQREQLMLLASEFDCRSSTLREVMWGERAEGPTVKLGLSGTHSQTSGIQGIRKAQVVKEEMIKRSPTI